MEDFPDEICMAVNICPGCPDLPSDTPKSFSSLLMDFSDTFVSKLEPHMRIRGAEMKIVLKEDFTPHKVFRACPIPRHLYG